ncbi:hypothetical protein L1887_38293 [Cichorium endivia]|nr:hypothetical protein L1887_38293 [Cichorium endivia]
MEGSNKLAMLLMVVFSAMLIVPSVLAATYTVGDSTGWATPTGGDPYSTWASRHTFVVGDVLVFNFASGSHTVANVTKSSFDNCNIGNPLSIQTNGPATFTITTVGSHYFICTILNHCSLNQKLTISANTNIDTGNTPSPESPPSAPSPFSSPPERSGAGALLDTLSSMFMFIGLINNEMNQQFDTFLMAWYHGSKDGAPTLDGGGGVLLLEVMMLGGVNGSEVADEVGGQEQCAFWGWGRWRCIGVVDKRVGVMVEDGVGVTDGGLAAATNETLIVNF